MGCRALLRGDLPDPRIEPGSPALQVDSLPTELQGKLSLLVTISLFSMPVSLLLFYESVRLCHILDAAATWHHHDVGPFLTVTLSTSIPYSDIHVASHGIISFFLMTESYSVGYT